jgi:hypothetical protein
MGAESVFYCPITLHQGEGSGSVLAPLVNSLAHEQNIIDSVVLLSESIASALQGLQIFSDTRWRLVIPMTTVCQSLVNGYSIAIYTDLIIAVTVNDTNVVYKNGQLSPSKILLPDGSVYGVLIPGASAEIRIPVEPTPNFQAYTALTDVSGHRVMKIAIGGVTYASSDHIHDANLVLGITMNAGSAGNKVDVQLSGEMTEPSWNWIAGDPVFCGTDGMLTQTMPTSGFAIIMAEAILPQTIIVTIKSPIIVGL